MTDNHDQIMLHYLIFSSLFSLLIGPKKKKEKKEKNENKINELKNSWIKKVNYS